MTTKELLDISNESLLDNTTTDEIINKDNSKNDTDEIIINKDNFENDMEKSNLKKECYICYQKSKKYGNYIHPCKCKGTLRYVHEKCLIKWIATSGKTKCTQCHYEFKYSEAFPSFIEAFIDTYASYIVLGICCFFIFVIFQILSFFFKRFSFTVKVFGSIDLFTNICGMLFLYFRYNSSGSFSNLLSEIEFNNQHVDNFYLTRYFIDACIKFIRSKVKLKKQLQNCED